MVQTFVETLKTTKATMSPALHQVLTQVCELYAVYWMLKNLGFFLMVGREAIFMLDLEVNLSTSF